MSKGEEIIIPEQEEIMHIKNKNMIVSASAGSGKTHIMIKKIFQYILDGDCHVDELLVLTYTKSAAMEMKKRLLDRLKESVNEKEFLQDELDKVQTADISTFDSFCQKLIKKYFYVLDIDPSFSVLDEKDEVYEQAKAMEKAIAEMKSAEPEMYSHLIENLASNRDENSIKATILKIYNYSTSILSIEEFWNKTKSLYDKNERIAEKYLCEYYNDVVGDYKARLEEQRGRAVELEFGRYVEYITNLISICDGFLISESFSKKVSVIDNFDFGTLRKERGDNLGLKDEIKDIRDDMVETFKTIKESYGTPEEIEASYDYCGKLINSIFELLNRFIEKYQTAKIGANKFDFNDIERLTIKLLEKEELKEQIKKSYKYIFVDEFQDANAVQEKIISLIKNNNLFFVGDTKQSIYAFRQSDPDIFLDIEKDFGGEDENSVAKTLNCNFRTNKNILYFANEIFNVIMTEKTAGINYRAKAQFDPKAKIEDVDNEVCVSLNLINSAVEGGELPKPTTVYDIKEDRGLNVAINKYDEECLFICNKIAELLGQKIYDKELKKERAIDFSDITILLRKRKPYQNYLIKHFVELGIPYTVSNNDELESLYDNTVLFNLIKLAYNKSDDYAIYSVISSSLFNFSDGDFASVRLKTDCEYFYEALYEYAQKFNDELANKLKEFYKTIEEFSFNAKYKGIYYALSRIVKESEYLLKISFEPDFENRRVNIRAFIDSFWNSKYNFDLCSYVTFRESTQRDVGVKNTKASSKAVQIATMHSSKGLEYPVVILPGLSQNFNNSGNGYSPDGRVRVGSVIEINKELGVGIKLFNDDERSVNYGIFYDACKLKNKVSETSEKIRLLYVAITRAENKLILTGINNGKFKRLTSDMNILRQNNFLSLIIGSLSQEEIDRINKLETFDANLFNNNKLKLCADEVKVEENKFAGEKVVVEENEKYASKLAEYLNIDLLKKQKNLALKNSVSGIALDDYSCVNMMPKLLNKNEHLNEISTDDGTLYHLLLEKIDFENINSVFDVEQFVSCNFSNEEIETIKQFGYEKIFNNIEILKKYTTGKKILKEQKFVMRVPHSSLVDGGEECKILVQGIMDLVVLAEDKIVLFDYKYTNKSDEQIISSYKKQIDIYTKALRLGFGGASVKRYILNLSKNSLISL